jgi:hypothetical protein
VTLVYRGSVFERLQGVETHEATPLAEENGDLVAVLEVERLRLNVRDAAERLSVNPLVLEAAHGADLRSATGGEPVLKLARVVLRHVPSLGTVTVTVKAAA